MVKHIRFGADAFCSDCNARAASRLAWRNTQFEGWVVDVESRYGVDGKRLLCTSESFSDHLKERDILRQRCAAVRGKLPPKQIAYEKFEEKVRGFEEPLGVLFSD